MAVLSVTLPADITGTPPAYKLYMRTMDNAWRYGSLIAPVQIEYGGFAGEWSEVPRDGRQPYLVYEGSNLLTLDFTMRLVDSFNPDRSIEGALNHLRGMSRSLSPISLTYGGSFDTRLWRMNDLKIKVTRRHPVSSQPTDAEVTVSLIMASDIQLTTGPVSGGKKATTTKTTVKKPTSSKKTSSSKKASKSKGKTKYYIVKRGDNVTSIAIKVYHDARKWRKLCDLNKIKNPKKQLKVGKKLKV